MPLSPGDKDATSGMTKAIYEELLDAFSSDLGELDSGEVEQIEANYRKLAHAISRGVIKHIRANMEIRGVEVEGGISAAVGGNTGAASSHTHPVSLTAQQESVTFRQSNDGAGLVE